MRPRFTAISFFRRWKALTISCFAHIVHDGITAMLYVLFPVWQAQLALSFTQVGFLKMLTDGAISMFQIPSGMLAERVGERKMLLAGTLLTGSAVFFFGSAPTLLLLGLLLMLSGMGSSVQHPLASCVISRSYHGKELRTALGVYNFSGDIGKLLIPALAALLLSRLSVSTTSHLIAVLALVAGPVIFIALTDSSLSMPTPAKTEQSALHEPGQSFKKIMNPAFLSLASIGLIDQAITTGFLTFLPFTLREKGAGVVTTGLVLSLVFAGGAAGKFVCGVLATRIGILRTVCITEAVTAVGIICMIILSLKNAMFLAPILGIALSGTSSVLYGSVPELVSGNHRRRAFSIFYTITLGAGAISPFFFGFVGDFTGVTAAVAIIAALALTTLPLTLPLRGKLAQSY